MSFSLAHLMFCLQMTISSKRHPYSIFLNTKWFQQLFELLRKDFIFSRPLKEEGQLVLCLSMALQPSPLAFVDITHIFNLVQDSSIPYVFQSARFHPRYWIESASSRLYRSELRRFFNLLMIVAGLTGTDNIMDATTIERHPIICACSTSPSRLFCIQDKSAAKAVWVLAEIALLCPFREISSTASNDI